MNKIERAKEIQSLTITNHFIHRYLERIWDRKQKMESLPDIERIIKDDLLNKMLKREIKALHLFKNQLKLKLPYARYNTLVISKSTLITVY